MKDKGNEEIQEDWWRNDMKKGRNTDCSELGRDAGTHSFFMRSGESLAWSVMV